MYSVSTQQRFWSKVAKDDAGCWLWQGALNPGGYGYFGVQSGRSRLAHRVAWEMSYGPITDGLYVLHRCDVRHCVNARDCLFLGTHLDNMADMRAKGRSPKSALGRIGAAAPNAQLTTEQIIDIRVRLAAGESQRSIARSLGRSQSTISLIANRKTWATA